MRTAYSSSEILDTIFDNHFQTFTPYASKALNKDVVYDTSDSEFYIFDKDQTHPGYWTCECQKLKHRLSIEGSCGECGATKESCGDSYIRELVHDNVIKACDVEEVRKPSRFVIKIDLTCPYCQKQTSARARELKMNCTHCNGAIDLNDIGGD